MTTTRPAKLSTGDEAIAAVLASAAALEALKAASALHRKVGSKTTLANRDAAERAWEATNEREFAALEAHDGSPGESAIVAA